MVPALFSEVARLRAADLRMLALGTYARHGLSHSRSLLGAAVSPLPATHVAALSARSSWILRSVQSLGRRSSDFRVEPAHRRPTLASKDPGRPSRLWRHYELRERTTSRAAQCATSAVGVGER